MTTPNPAPAAALSTCRLLVATPMYDGAQGTYVRSALALTLAAQARGVAIDFAFIMHQPSINRARNLLSHIFLRSDFTHMLFIDSDVSFQSDDIWSMIDAMAAKPDCAILGGPVPRRSINWNTVARAASLGLGQDNPAALARFTGDFAFALADPSQGFRLDQLVELARLGTGLMLIRRDVITTLTDRHPELIYRPDVEERNGYGTGDEICALFQPMTDPHTKSMLSDDYAFCLRARNAGFAIYLAPWVKTTHTGPVTFAGTLADLVPLSAAPPA